MQYLSSMSIARKLTLLIASAIVGSMILSGVFLWSERQLILQERETAVRQTVELAHGLLVHFHGLSEQGKISEEQAKQQALESIRGLRYGLSEYFWINDMQPKMIMHPIKPELQGNDLSDFKSPQGQLIFNDFVAEVRANQAGFVGYLWPKPGTTESVRKISYVKGFAPWGWLVGSGVYLDSVDTAVWSRAQDFAAGTALMVLVLLAISMLIGRGILSQLGGEPHYANGITLRIALGDLTTPITLPPHDDHSVLHGINAMQTQFSGIVSRVREGANELATASTEIAQGNNDLSARTESQASAIEQTAASMDQLNATAKQNAKNAVQANQLAELASSTAVQGGSVVAEVVRTMQHINDSSKRIFDIIGVIDSIAFQTNILALNAAVEAARAGEQGRGFAVVATEVRSLAGRSAAAAKEIKTLIGESVARVDQGSELVDKAGRTMNDVVTSIQQVTNIMREINSASQEQCSGVAQVGAAVMQIDQLTQQNAALVEQMAAAAVRLRAQAQELVLSVAVFKLSATID